MEEYQSPEMEMLDLQAMDIITTSGNPDELPDDEW